MPASGSCIEENGVLSCVIVPGVDVLAETFKRLYVDTLEQSTSFFGLTHRSSEKSVERLRFVGDQCWMKEEFVPIGPHQKSEGPRLQKAELLSYEG